jgi:hypothetical protein
MMILFVKLTKGIGHKFYQLMKSSPTSSSYQYYENFEDVKVEHIKFQDNKVEKTLATAYLKTTTT